jgi:tellurite methyltransferase
MEAWNQAWLTDAGREAWLTPEPFVVAALPELQAAGVLRVLDLGFGVGRHTLLLARAGFAVAGIDASANGLAYTQEWAQREGFTVELTTGDMTTLPYATAEFDAILTWNVIYHGTMDVIQQTIDEITRCLKPGGYLVCSLISAQHLMAGQGEEIEPRTYVIPGSGEREHPHHYFNRADIERCFGDYTILRLEDATQKKSDDYHWHMLAQRKA